MSDSTRRTSRRRRIVDRAEPGGDVPVVVVTIVASLAMLVPGVWAWVDPPSFAAVMNWAPHRHFVHDAGAFQIGLGVTLLSSLWWRDVVAVVLAGFVLTTSLHAVNHLIDLPLGGRSSDPYALGLVSVIAALGLMARIRRLRRRGSGSGLRAPGGLRGELGPRGDVELGEDVREVGLDGTS